MKQTRHKILTDFGQIRTVEKRVQQTFPGDYSNLYGEAFPPFLLSRIGLMISVPVMPISDANVCGKSFHLASIRPCKYVQPFPQVRATVLASTCNRSRKYVQPSLQVLAGKRHNTSSFRNLFPPCFSTEPSPDHYSLLP